MKKIRIIVCTILSVTIFFSTCIIGFATNSPGERTVTRSYEVPVDIIVSPNVKSDLIPYVTNALVTEVYSTDINGTEILRSTAFTFTNNYKDIGLNVLCGKGSINFYYNVASPNNTFDAVKGATVSGLQNLNSYTNFTVSVTQVTTSSLYHNASANRPSGGIKIYGYYYLYFSGSTLCLYVI